MKCAIAWLAATLVSTTAIAGDPAAEATRAYTIDVGSSTTRIGLGESGKLAVEIRPRLPAWHVHPQAPLRIKLEGPAGLRIVKQTLGRKDVIDPKSETPRFETTFVAVARGVHEAKATVDFFICSADACVKQVKEVTVTVAVR